MPTQAPLFPEQASTMAGRIDALFFALLGVAGFFTALIFGLILVFAIRYRRRPGRSSVFRTREPLWMELTWTAVPLAIAVGIFIWGAALYVEAARPPAGALQVFVVGKQWMWKIQHPEGPREINELHVPVGRPIRLTLASEDVIHSFYVPAFRMKQDAVPGRTTVAWFEATRPGVHRLFCAEYCGAGHSAMTGRVVVMEPREYERWLEGGGRGETIEASGRRLAERLGCLTCHVPGGGDRGPDLVGLFGKEVRLRDGTARIADEAYVRESILDPAAKITAGYEPLMPTYQGQIGEEDMLRILAWLKSLNEQKPEFRSQKPE
ncbi:MAG: cytochrome c oxidase subunit II [Planctomycetes bacterium]|nr:cytochrome c oxidase subunit II [Planctomycetota bacterium]